MPAYSVWFWQRCQRHLLKKLHLGPKTPWNNLTISILLLTLSSNREDIWRSSSLHLQSKPFLRGLIHWLASHTRWDTVPLCLLQSPLWRGVCREEKLSLSFLDLHLEDLLCFGQGRPTGRKATSYWGAGKSFLFPPAHQHGYKGGFHFVAAPTSKRNLCVWRNLLFSIKKQQVGQKRKGEGNIVSNLSDGKPFFCSILIKL